LKSPTNSFCSCELRSRQWTARARARHLGEIEEPVGDALHLPAALLLHGRRREVHILDDLQDLLGGRLHDLGRAHFRLRAAARGEQDPHGQCLLHDSLPVQPAPG
jgi:hypothetical protein